MQVYVGWQEKRSVRTSGGKKKGQFATISDDTQVFVYQGLEFLDVITCLTPAFCRHES